MSSREEASTTAPEHRVAGASAGSTIVAATCPQAAFSLRRVGTIARRLGALLAPVLLPSWRFFDSIGPAPRLLVGRADETAQGWADLTAQPATRGPLATVGALLHDPVRNEALFWVSLAERVLAGDDPTALPTLRRFLRQWAQADALSPETVLLVRILVRDPELGWAERLAHEESVSLGGAQVGSA